MAEYLPVCRWWCWKYLAAELLEEAPLEVEPSVVKVLQVVVLELLSPVRVVACSVALEFVVLPMKRAVECAVVDRTGLSPGHAVLRT